MSAGASGMRCMYDLLLPKARCPNKQSKWLPRLSEKRIFAAKNTSAIGVHSGLCGKVRPPHTYLPPTYRSKPSVPAQACRARAARRGGAEAGALHPARGRHRLAPQLTSLQPLRRRAAGVAQKATAGCGLLPCPGTRRASPGCLTAHGSHGCSPPPPRVPRRHACPPLPDARSVQRRRARVTGTDGAAAAPAVAAPPLRRARRARAAAAAAAAPSSPSSPPLPSVARARLRAPAPTRRPSTPAAQPACLLGHRRTGRGGGAARGDGGIPKAASQGLHPHRTTAYEGDGRRCKARVAPPLRAKMSRMSRRCFSKL